MSTDEATGTEAPGLTADMLAAIRERHEFATIEGGNWSLLEELHQARLRLADEDLPALLAEVEGPWCISDPHQRNVIIQALAYAAGCAPDPGEQVEFEALLELLVGEQA